MDVLLRGGRVIDPATGMDQIADVAVGDGRILAVGPGLAAEGSAEIIDVSGKLVTAGLIDTHAHVYQHVLGKFGLNADMVGVQSGVTTLLDQGGPSCMTMAGFRNYVVAPAKSRVLTFMSCYLVGGMEGHLYPSLHGPEQMNVEHTVRVARENLDIVKGIKAHAEIGGASRWGLEVIKLAAQIAREVDVPLYIHLGQLWPAKEGASIDPDEVVRAVVPLMRAGDVLAHPFTRHPGGFVSAQTGEVHPIVWEALERGLIFDVGHGSHFSFEMARRVLAAGIRPHTLGADLHGYNVRVPEASESEVTKRNPFFGVAPFSLTHAMTELLTLGLSLAEIVPLVTSNPAKMVGMAESLGSLQVGREADVTVMEVLKGRFELKDNSGETVVAPEMIVPVFALKAGQRFDATSPLIPPVKMAA